MRLSRGLTALRTQVSWSKFMAIGGDAINNDSAQAVLAAYNWWDSATGPTVDDNPNGTGEPVNGAVVYRPFLLGPSGSFVFLPHIKR
jgi:hypothetical protein